MIISNIVDKKTLREVQKETLDKIAECLLRSFGPYASSTKIVRQVNEQGGRISVATKYTKDGHTILKNIGFQEFIEESVRDDLEDVTRNIVKTVGDGTTSAVLLSRNIFNNLIDIEEKENKSPYEIMEEFREAVQAIKEKILEKKQEFNPEIAYKIAYISSNGNEEVATNIKNIYKKFGNDVFIDVAISNTEHNILKEYNGMTLEAGYDDRAYINDAKKGVCSLRHPKIYTFEDPIDTPEMFSFFDKIIEENILKPAKVQDGTIYPTVIIAPKISSDMSSYLKQLVSYMYSIQDVSMRLPILIVSNIYRKEQLLDIAQLCGCKTIKKYLDPKIQDQDIAKGLAPTPDTIVDFSGSCDLIESDLAKTKFVNPQEMYGEDGEYSSTFKSLLEFLQSELARAYEENEDNNVTGNLKRRINSLKANMVDYLVGGISSTDRDNLRDLVEDSVLNCRSAARYGVGRGANFEGYRATVDCSTKDVMAGKTDKIYKIIADAYNELIITLYSTCMSVADAKLYLTKSCKKDMPYNLRTKQFDGNVLSSIMSDVVVLESISKIITLMYASNQFLCPTPASNKYIFNN